MSTCRVCAHLNRPAAHFCANCRAPIFLQNKYRVTRLLGRSGYGTVYQAEHTGLGGALYAIKELLPDPAAAPQQQQAASEQFRLEARILAHLSHPALPRIVDFFAEGNRDYLVMEYIEGETLEEWLNHNHAPFAESQVIAWAQELCDALTYLHTCQPKPVIHRAVKPSNIQITPEGKLKLLGLGVGELRVVDVTAPDATRAVSPPYSPLEQYGRGTDPRSDIYALGVTLYQLLTNNLPPAAPDRLSETVLLPRQLNPAVSLAVEAVVLKALAQKPGERFQSAIEMKQALQLPTSYTVPVPMSLPVIAQPSADSKKWAWLALGCIGIVLVLGVLFFGLSLLFSQPPPPTTIARATVTPAVIERPSATAVPVLSTPTLAASAVTATAQASATSAAQAMATVLAEIRGAAKTYGPVSGKLDHRDDNTFPIWHASVWWKNFIAEVRFFNPYDRSERGWDYGFTFRQTGQNIEYRLYVSSDAKWVLGLATGTSDTKFANVKAIASGDTRKMDLSATGSNLLRIEVQEKSALFLVNGEAIATLDLSDKIEPGDLGVGTGFDNNHMLKGRSTSFENFSAWRQ